jgi:pimeloyl-ACP methyl ester carboxylesterase
MMKSSGVAAVFCLVGILILPLPLPGQETGVGAVAKINGMEMYYETMGSGEPLLLVHGWSGNADYFEPLLDELAAEYLLIIPELRGHGRSTNPGGTFTTKLAAADVSALLDHLGVKEVRALGASAGALILLHMAVEQPSRIRRMILVGSGTHFPPTCRASMAAADPDSYSPQWWDVMRNRHAYGDGQIRAIAAMLPALAAEEDDVAFTPEILGSIQNPTFIVHGDSDWCFPPSMAADMYESLPDADLWVIPNGEHVPILGAWAPQFLDLALGFLRTEDHEELSEPPPESVHPGGRGDSDGQRNLEPFR